MSVPPQPDAGRPAPGPPASDLPSPSSLPFFEVLWQGESIGDGGDLQEALACYALVRPEDGDWNEACGRPGVDPCIRRYASFDAYLDNDDELETIPVTVAMIEAALPGPAPAEPS
jgi:hypothetical protein